MAESSESLQKSLVDKNPLLPNTIDSLDFSIRVNDPLCGRELF